MVDPPRLLHRRAEYAYTDKPALAMTGEPEAVSRDEQTAITQRAQRAWREARHQRWDDARKTIDRVADDFASSINGDPALHTALRAVHRSAEAVTRRLA